MGFYIAMDGPAGAGKSAVVAAVGGILNMYSLNTGAMYRAMGLYMIRNGVNTKDEKAVALACADVQIDVEYIDGKQHTLLMGEDVTGELITAGDAASDIAKVPEVRERLVALQRQIASSKRMIMDGRDIGTVVLPDAPLKIYLTASAEERAKRRVKHLIDEGKPEEADYDTVLKGIIDRDYQDMHRELSPLMKAEDAIEVDTTHMTLDEVVAHIVQLAREAGA